MFDNPTTQPNNDPNQNTAPGDATAPAGNTASLAGSLATPMMAPKSSLPKTPTSEPEDIFAGTEGPKAGATERARSFAPIDANDNVVAQPASADQTADSEPNVAEMAASSRLAMPARGKKKKRYVFFGVIVIIILLIVFVGMIGLAYMKSNDLSFNQILNKIGLGSEEVQPEVMAPDSTAENAPDAVDSDLPPQDDTIAPADTDSGNLPTDEMNVEPDIEDDSVASDLENALIDDDFSGVLEEVIDSDNDGITDADEKNIGTNPEKADTDDDGLSDREEIFIYGTNPMDPDSDKDGYLDGDEVKNGYNPRGPGVIYELP
ncbi:MAG: hypothetical protein Q8Q23_01550 [bacterium]|nr:hypothetical protein [bacterium]